MGEVLRKSVNCSDIGGVCSGNAVCVVMHGTKHTPFTTSLYPAVLRSFPTVQAHHLRAAKALPLKRGHESSLYLACAIAC